MNFRNSLKKYKDIDFVKRFEYVANVRYFRYLPVETL